MKRLAILILGVFWANILFAQTVVQQVWVSQYSSGGNFLQDLANQMAMDSNGNIFVAGHRVNSDSTMDIQILKMDASGTVVASAVLNGTDNKNDKVKSISVDADGNVIIAGTLDNADTQKDLLVVKFDNDLNELWRYVYDGAGSYDDRARDLTVDDQGNVYVTGYSMESTSPWVAPDAITLKLAADGSLIWKAIYDGPDNQHDEGKGIVVDDSANVYVAGYSRNSQSQWDLIVLKYDSDGNLVWSAQYDNAAGNDFAVQIAKKDNGVVVSGVSSRNGGDILVVSYDNAGNEEWAQVYDSGNNAQDEPFDMAVDGDGNIIIGATLDGSAFDATRDYGILKFDASGNLLWVNRYDGPANDWDDLNALALDTHNKIYVTGQSNGVDSGPDFASLRYEEDGTGMWEARYSSAGNKSDQAMDVLVDSEGNVFVVGSANLDSVPGVVLIKYDQVLVAPTLVSPADSAVQVELNPTLEWNGVNGAESYQVQVALDDQFTNIIVDSTTQSTSMTINGLDYDTPYYWRVRASNYTGDGMWSDTWMFRTKLQLPDKVSLLQPVSGDTIETDSVRLVWNASQPEVDQYQVQISTLDDFSTTELDTIVADTTFLATNLSDGTTYFWRVRAHNVSGWGEFSDTWQFTVKIPLPLPAAVVLASPENGAVINADSVQLVWHPSQPEILHYLVEVSTKADFSELLVADSTVTDTAYMVTGLSDSTTYYWRVKAHNATGWGEYSDVWEFTTQFAAPLSLPDKVVLKSPDNGSTLDTLEVDLMWFASQPEVDSYQLRVATDTAFSNLVADTVVTDTSFHLTGLENNKTYYWKVRAHNATGWGEFSDTWNFSITITGIVTGGEVPVVFQLKQNYPNPFNPSTTIEYQLPVRSYVKLEIYNAVGEKIATLVNGEQNAQVHRVQWFARVPTGIYFYKLTAVDVNDPSHRFEQIRKMLLIK